MHFKNRLKCLGFRLFHEANIENHLKDRMRINWLEIREVWRQIQCLVVFCHSFQVLPEHFWGSGRITEGCSCRQMILTCTVLSATKF